MVVVGRAKAMKTLASNDLFTEFPNGSDMHAGGTDSEPPSKGQSLTVPPRIAVMPHANDRLSIAAFFATQGNGIARTGRIDSSGHATGLAGASSRAASVPRKSEHRLLTLKIRGETPQAICSMAGRLGCPGAKRTP
jgi:hypothetical protein